MTVRKVLKLFIDGDKSPDIIQGICVIFDTTTKEVCNNYSRYLVLARELLEDLNSIRKE